MRKGETTLVEVLVIIAIIGILTALLSGGCKGCNGYYSKQGNGTYRCIKTYVVAAGEGSHKRVDLKELNSDYVSTFNCDDDLWLGQWNSATIYAQFEPNKWYHIDYTGHRNEHWSIFPIITKVREIPAPKVEK